ncbi:MAG: flagellar brake protein [Thiobacillaceae bacterium]
MRKADIVIGKPLPWAVYDANHVLLLNKGVVVESEFQLQTLMEKGMYREGRSRLLPSTHTITGPGTSNEEDDRGEDIPFDRVRLLPGDLIQIQPLQEGAVARYNVRCIGMLAGKSLLVTSPTAEDRVVYIREGVGVLARAFSGVFVCGFKARVLKSYLMPYPHLHLTYPASVHAVRVRKAMRAPVDIIVAIYEREGGELVASGRIVDLSVGGARIHSPVQFGNVGSRVFITFKVKLDEIEEIVTTPAYLRSLGEDTDEKGKPVKVVGIQFGEITQSQQLIIMNLVYQHLFKEA